MSRITDKNIESVFTVLDDTFSGVNNKVNPENLENPDLVASMKNLVNYFQTNATVSISSPFQGTCLQVSKDEKRIYFGSRKEKNHQARIGVADISSLEIILDEGVSDKSVWTIALSDDEKYLYAAGQNPNIIKFRISDFVEVDSFIGHTEEVNKIIITEDKKWLFSASNDETLRMWSIHESPSRHIILLNSGGKIHSLDLSKDQYFLCCGDSQGLITIFENSFSLSIPPKKIGKINIKKAIWALKVSPNVNFLASGDEMGIIYLYRFHTWENIGIFNHGGLIRDIDISKAEDIFVSAGENSEVKIWDVSQRFKEITFTKHTNWVKSVVIMKDQKHIISYGDDKAIMIWKIPRFEEKKLMNTKGMNILHLWFSETRGLLESICKINDEVFIVSWENNGNPVFTMKIENDNPEFCKNIENIDEVFVAGTTNDEIIENLHDEDGQGYTIISIYNVFLQQMIRSHTIKAQMISFYISGNLLVIGEGFKLTLWQYNDLTHLKTIFSRHGEIRSIALAFNETIMFTFDTDELLKKISLDLNNEHFFQELGHRNSFALSTKIVNTENKDNIKKYNFILELSDDSQYLYAANDIKVEIIYTMNFSMIFTIDTSYTRILKNIKNTICFIRQEGMDIYSSKNFQLLSQVTYNFTNKKVILGAKNNFIYFFDEDSITRIQNPLKCKDVTLVGDFSDEKIFQEHIESIINGRCLRPFFKSQWLIEPLHVNLLHIYAYFNLYDILEDAIIGDGLQKRIAFINSKEGFSALSVSINMNFYESTETIVDSLKKLAKSEASKTVLEKLVLQEFEENLSDLNIRGYNGLEKLYKMILFKEDLLSLPNFCPPEITLPVLVKSDSFYIFSKDFNLSDEIPETGVAILFSKTLVRLYLSLGSSKSIEFMKSIQDCPITSIYYTKLIQLILKEKWKSVRWYMWIQAFAYLCYILLLSLYVSYEPCRNSWFLIFPFMINGILYTYEVIFMIIGRLKYFLDFWNCIDSIRSWLMISYTLMVWGGFFDISEKKNTDERFMLAVLIFVSWMRGITYFRLNSNTRYLNKVLSQVIADIFPFLIILFYSVIAFALIFRAFDSDLKTDYFPSLTKSYLIIIGSWDNPITPDFASLILFFATLLNPIISLNLLISILTGTFERVSEDEAIADGQELAGMIIEIETLMFWARNNNEKTFLHIMEQDNIDEESDNNLNKLVNNINAKISFIKGYINFHDIAKNRLKEAFTKGGQDLSKSLEILLKK
ncbi:hypothetical protein SteCoe_27308 [Stentor coeruleus]|uniref:Uncharacterized protein n=1 Tax=Stentor coeruleus TaxID=5963 RepID=A0A1R2BAU6_9CILI|nr:hypothetical protein SteCoe_27308 [Stentor coeruleus]